MRLFLGFFAVVSGREIKVSSEGSSLLEEDEDGFEAFGVRMSRETDPSSSFVELAEAQDGPAEDGEPGAEVMGGKGGLAHSSFADIEAFTSPGSEKYTGKSMNVGFVNMGGRFQNPFEFMKQGVADPSDASDWITNYNKMVKATEDEVPYDLLAFLAGDCTPAPRSTGRPMLKLLDDAIKADKHCELKTGKAIEEGNYYKIVDATTATPTEPKVTYAAAETPTFAVGRLMSADCPEEGCRVLSEDKLKATGLKITFQDLYKKDKKVKSLSNENRWKHTTNPLHGDEPIDTAWQVDAIRELNGKSRQSFIENFQITWLKDKSRPADIHDFGAVLLWDWYANHALGAMDKSTYMALVKGSPHISKRGETGTTKYPAEEVKAWPVDTPKEGSTKLLTKIETLLSPFKTADVLGLAEVPLDGNSVAHEFMYKADKLGYKVLVPAPIKNVELALLYKKDTVWTRLELPQTLEQLKSDASVHESLRNNVNLGTAYRKTLCAENDSTKMCVCVVHFKKFNDKKGIAAAKAEAKKAQGKEVVDAKRSKGQFPKEEDHNGEAMKLAAHYFNWLTSKFGSHCVIMSDTNVEKGSHTHMDTALATLQFLNPFKDVMTTRKMRTEFQPQAKKAQDLAVEPKDRIVAKKGKVVISEASLIGASGVTQLKDVEWDAATKKMAETKTKAEVRLGLQAADWPSDHNGVLVTVSAPA